MFNDISEAMQQRMTQLQQLDAADRAEGVTRMERLRQIPAEVGKFLALLAASSPEGNMLEIGTSGGYSTMWISLACRTLGRKLKTFELLEAKATIARETFRLAEIEEIVDFNHANALDHIGNCTDIAFCFLDAEKEVYADSYELVVPNLVSGGLLVADNAISHVEELTPMIERAIADARVDAMVVPIGNGELVCRKK